MFDLLKEGLEEAVEYHKGNVKLRTKEVFIPDAPKNYCAKDIKNLRAKLGITQSELASWLNISLNTVQAWEQSSRNPSHSSLRLLEVFDKDFSFIKKIIKGKETKRAAKHTRKQGPCSSHVISKSSMVAKSRHS